ncbi:MAG: HAMP domain-containing histidine kinase [Solobacterium sp.]|nr:HAMP domain-containing histidine kinase [Solobacterium sp.]
MKKQISLKWKIGRYLLLFGVFIILVMFIFQIGLLEPMYEQSKINTVKLVSDTIVNALDDDMDDDALEELVFENEVKNDTCIRYFRTEEGHTSDSYDMYYMNGCLLYRMRPEEINENIANALSSQDKTYLGISEANMNMPISENGFRNIIYTRILQDDDKTSIVMVYTGISSVGAALQTLRNQMLYIGIILICGVILLTLLLYKQIAKPLLSINQQAKSLPEGKYDPDPQTNRYREAQELNETLVKAAEDIQKADKAKRDLIANVSHDLRTPLTMISGYGEMMIDLPEEKTDENIKVIIDESKRLTNLVNDLLDLSKMQENKIVLKEEQFDLTELIKDQLRKYDVYQYRDGFVIEEKLPDCVMVRADQKRIEQVLNNFITNAINYSLENKHIIVKETENDGYVTVSIQDFGQGIAKENLADIWDRYYKVDKTHVRASSGSGIGLAIVKEILDLHHAEYGVESEPGKGSTFWFKLPVVK